MAKKPQAQQRKPAAAAPTARAAIRSDKAQTSGSRDLEYLRFDMLPTTSTFSNDGSMVRWDIRETIVDRRAGTRTIEVIWGDKSNVEVMAMAMATSAPGVIREEVSAFFMSRRIGPILESLIPINTVTVNDAVFDTSKVVSAIQTAVSIKAAIVILEFVIPYLRRLGVMTETGRFTTEIYYPNVQPTVASLTEDVVIQNAAAEAARIDIASISGRKHTKQTFAAAVAEKLVQIGESFMDSVLFTNLFDDILVAIRERATLGYPHAWMGECPISWRNDATVKALSSNYVFAKAAFELPVTQSATPVNSLHELSDRAKLALAALNTSRRYAIVSAGEYCRNILKKNVRDQVGTSRMFLLARNAAPFAVAQTVTAFVDSVLPDVVTNIGTATEGLDKFLAAGYADTSKLSVGHHFDELHKSARYLIEAGFKPDYLGYGVNVGGDSFEYGHELSSLLATELWVKMPGEADINAFMQTGTEFAYDWVFGVRTEEREFRRPQMDARLMGDILYTSNIGEVLLALPDLVQSEYMPARPQLLSKDIQRTRLVQFDQEASLIALGRRFSFDIELGRQQIQGSFYNHSVGFLSSVRDVFIVKPVFNIDVMHSVADLYGIFDALLADIAKWNAVGANVKIPTVLIDFVKRQKTLGLISMARGVSKVFRDAVQQVIAMRALESMDEESAVLARGQLQQQQFAGYADLYALYVFLDTQGVKAEFVAEVIGAPESLAVILEHGSDRM